jgi:hypothetical protein
MYGPQFSFHSLHIRATSSSPSPCLPSLPIARPDSYYQSASPSPLTAATTPCSSSVFANAPARRRPFEEYRIFTDKYRFSARTASSRWCCLGESFMKLAPLRRIRLDLLSSSSGSCALGEEFPSYRGCRDQGPSGRNPNAKYLSIFLQEYINVDLIEIEFM